MLYGTELMSGCGRGCRYRGWETRRNDLKISEMKPSVMQGLCVKTP